MCTCGANIGSYIKTYWANVNAKTVKIKLEDIAKSSTATKEILDAMFIENICCRANIIAAIRQNEAKNIENKKNDKPVHSLDSKEAKAS